MEHRIMSYTNVTNEELIKYHMDSVNDDLRREIERRLLDDKNQEVIEAKENFRDAISGIHDHLGEDALCDVISALFEASKMNKAEMKEAILNAINVLEDKQTMGVYFVEHVYASLD
jgi:hypothetical protein